MKNNLTALQALKDCIAKHINEYITENNNFNVKLNAIKDNQIFVEFPDVDKLPLNETIYIIPDYTDLEPQTVCTMLNNDSVKVYVFCKRDTNKNLLAKASTIASSILQVVIKNTTLDGKVNLCELESLDFYPSVTATEGISAYEISLTIRYVLSV